MLTTASKPITIKTSNLQKVGAYPSPVSPSSLESSPSKYIQNYVLPLSFTENYTLLHELGFGGFGFVYAVRRLSDNIQLACKFIFKSKVSRNSWTSDRELGLCPMEVAVLKNVSHQNIIEYVDYFDDDIFCYCLTKMHGTEWASAQESRRSMDLFECIEKYEFFAEPLARHVFSQILDAVSHLHNIGLVHRDIKDENILIDDQFNVKLIDFGSAAFFDPKGIRLFDMFLGTKQYASPEILCQKQYRGPEAEIWALGCCLYIILTGSVPFASASQAVNQKFSTPSRKLSPVCMELLDRMLERDPTKRIRIDQVRAHNWVIMR